MAPMLTELDEFFAGVPMPLREVFAWLFHAAVRRRSMYAPLSHARFEMAVGASLTRTIRSVVDVGCGCGDKLWAFRTFCGPAVRIVGIECDAWAARWARVLCPFAEVIEGRGESVDLSGFDLVYCWAPSIVLAPHPRLIRPPVTGVRGPHGQDD